ncbi:MAG: hypothetical protein H6Q27_979, partial [Ignavibacteriaceae bacterium]|nr:hypothetical protein [Ignavibacteriaceae bacterium]
MKKNILSNWVFTLLLILTVAAYFGCEKKTDENGNKDKTKTELKTPDLTGKWSGVFDGKNAVLDIT